MKHDRQDRTAFTVVTVLPIFLLAPPGVNKVASKALVLLEAGNLVPTDLRLMESANLRIQEAALTGDSEAVEKGIFSGGVGPQILRFGFLFGILSLGMGAWHFFMGYADWQTIMFTTLAFCQVWQALGTRSGNDSLFRVGLSSNLPLLRLALLVIGAQLAAIYLPILQTFLQTSWLTPSDLLFCFGVSLLVLLYAEVEKIFLRSRLYLCRRDTRNGSC